MSWFKDEENSPKVKQTDDILDKLGGKTAGERQADPEDPVQEVLEEWRYDVDGEPFNR